RKLIEARYFCDHYQSDGDPSLLFSPHDYSGHGTHTLATTGGNFVPGASSCGLAYGIASGGAPRARVASYKVLWPDDKGGHTSYDQDIMNAYDATINDEVDVLSVSMGDEYPDRKYSYDGSYRSSFKAVANGIVVVKSAGNYGPDPKTLVNCEPWVITVAGSLCLVYIFSGWFSSAPIIFTAHLTCLCLGSMDGEKSSIVHRLSRHDPYFVGQDQVVLF
ncbi:subtilisin-like protease-like protein, partial [Trifolium pratense]